MDMNLGKFREMVTEREAVCHSLWDHKQTDTTWRLNTQTLFIPDKDFKLSVLKILKEEKNSTQRAEGTMEGTKANQKNI